MYKNPHCFTQLLVMELYCSLLCRNSTYFITDEIQLQEKNREKKIYSSLHIAYSVIFVQYPIYTKCKPKLKIDSRLTDLKAFLRAEKVCLEAMKRENHF